MTLTRGERRARRARARAKARRVLCYHRYGARSREDVPDAVAGRYADNLAKCRAPYWRETMGEKAAAWERRLADADKADEEAGR